MSTSRFDQLRRTLQAGEHRLVTFVQRAGARLPPFAEHDRAWVERRLAEVKAQRFGHLQPSVWSFLERFPPDGLILDGGSSDRLVHPRALSVDLQPGADLEWNIMRRGISRFCQPT